MKNLRQGATVLAATAVIVTGGVMLNSPATAEKPSGSEPCATQQTQLDKAEAKLDSLTQKFNATAAKVKKDQRAVAASKGSAKARARKALAAAKAEKARVAKAKKAQQQRVAHASARLDKCQAGTPTTTPTETAGA